MKLIRKSSLVRRQKDATIHCEIELCEAAGPPGRFLVNLRQGRTGEEWRESTRTPQPVDWQSAETLFELALVERAAQGFSEASPAPAPLMADGAAPAATTVRRDLDPAAVALLQKLEADSWKKLDQHDRNRVIWRVGERRLHSAVPTMVDLIARGDEMQDYCLAWAIGRCGDRGAAVAMQELHARGRTDAIRRMALQAWLLLADSEAQQAHATRLMYDWPAAVRSAWEQQDEQRLLSIAAGDDEWQGMSKTDWLEQLHQVAFSQPMARRVLLAHMKRMRFRAGTFRAVRHIYKAAEMAGDAELFGLIQQRFDTEHHTSGSQWVYVRRAYTKFAEEGTRPDSQVAYGLRTRDYLRRRGWRTLRRLGEDADPSYVTMALGVLAAMDDSDAGQADARRGHFYDRYSHWLMFNRLLRAHGDWLSNRSGTSWYQPQRIQPDERRQEAFPELWDAQPRALLSLMQQSRCAGVHAFAARALSDNQEFCAALALDTVRELLRSPFPSTAHFAYLVARRRFEPGVPPTEWLLLLIQCTLPEATQYALDCIARDPLHYAADPLLVAAIACAPVETVRRQGRMLCQVAATLPGQAPAIIMQLLDWLDNCADIDDARKAVPAIGADLQWLIENPLRDAAAGAPYERLLQLLGHQLAAVRLLACQWLMLHPAPAGMLSGSRLAMLLKDDDADVRGAAVRLFGTLPDHVLAAQTDLIMAFATSAEAGVRRGVDGVIQRLSAADAGFRSTLLAGLLDALFRSETGDGMHADLIAWLTGPLKDEAGLADPALLVRLLAARSKGALLLGARLLPGFNPGQFEVAAWAAFGRNPNASVRKWAFDAYRSDPQRVRNQMEAALRIFDSRFDDSREFASAYFTETCTRDDWTPLLLVNLCDHQDPAAQRFGRAMITRHFDVGDVTDLLDKLSQHPSANMQLFVSSWLESACAGDLGKLQRMEPYFLSVLSQVNRGRVVKGRVQQFLRAQAELSEEIGAFVARLFARQVLTVAIADKAQYIEGLRAIQQRYPQRPAAITIHTPAVRESKT
ncbi:hypothetical protein [Pseudoduganella violaceinigra]|uniref:hypothetical protein n=1 Tax=Pseudoduganella violaceinigra TaxID=246602 RepID=UPI0003FE68BA|nr:hypothetical protein [Pseudoduganella violaceinigra]